MNITVMGAGSWGTAFAQYAVGLGHTVVLVPRRLEQALRLTSSGENEEYLPGVRLDKSLQIISELRPALMEAELVVFACPSKGLRTACEGVRRELESAWQLKGAITLCKGLDSETLQYPAEVVEEVLGGSLCVGALSGPNNAAEVAKGCLAAAVLAFPEAAKAFAQSVQEALSSETFRLYRSADRRGVELGGALKNIYAIGAGLCQGLGLGDNARAAFLTRALGEMVKLGIQWGGQSQTFYGLSGLGDLMATAYGPWSRNRSFGEALGRGEAIEGVLGHAHGVVEGYGAVQAFFKKAQTEGLSAPILSSLYQILYAGEQPGRAVELLMRRPVGVEHNNI